MREIKSWFVGSFLSPVPESVSLVIDARRDSLRWPEEEPARAPGFGAWAQRQQWLDNQREDFRGELARLQAEYDIWLAQRLVSPARGDITSEWNSALLRQVAENAAKMGWCPHCGGDFMRHDRDCPRDRNSGRKCICGAELEEPGSRHAHWYKCPFRSAGKER